MNWLSPQPYSAKHGELRSKHVLNTGEWFLNHETFTDWIKGDVQLLVCVGIGLLIRLPGADFLAGSGKSVLMYDKYN
jgi:hypothetical protein